MDALTDNYVRYYKLQSGGRLPVFVGQDGDGIGDVLKGAVGKLMPYMFPVVKSSVNSFLDESEKLLAEGKNAKEILKSGLKAGFKGGLTTAKDSFLDNLALASKNEKAQTGSGRKRKRRAAPKKKRAKRQKLYKGQKKNKRRKPKRKPTRKLAFRTNF